MSDQKKPDPWQGKNRITVVAEIVKYFPLERKGFMKSVDPPISKRIALYLPCLPGPLEEKVRALTDRLSKQKKKRLNPDPEFGALMTEIKSTLIHKRFRCEIVKDKKKEFSVQRGTMEPLEISP